MRVHFSTDDVLPRDRPQFWRDFVAEHVMKATPTARSDPATFWGTVDVHITKRFKLFNYQDSSRSGGRTAADVGRDNSQRFHLHRVPHEQTYTAMPARKTA